MTPEKPGPGSKPASQPGRTPAVDLRLLRRPGNSTTAISNAGNSTAGADLSVDRLELRAPSGGVSRRALSSARIVVVGANYSPEPSGIGPRTAIMARHLAQVAGHVTVLTGIPHHPDTRLATVYRHRRHQTADGWVRVVRHPHPTPATAGLVGSARYELGFYRAVTSSPLIDPPHVVIGVTPSIGGAVAAAELARRHQARLLIVVQDLVPARPRHDGLVKAALRRFERRVLLEADEIAVVHESLRQRVIAMGVDDDRVQLVPNPELGVTSPLDTRQARALLGWPQDEVIVVRTGNVGSAEESAMLLRTARVLAHNGSRVRMLVVGEGSRLEGLRRASAGLSSIGFVAPNGPAQYPTVLAAADILVLTERVERADSSALGRFSSYLAAGRPVVAALHPQSPAAATVARAATAGAVRLVAAGDPGGLASAITRLAADPHQRRVMSTAARESAAVRLTGTTAGERLERLVESMLWRPSLVPAQRQPDEDT